MIAFLISERTVIALILINTLVLFLDEFPNVHSFTRGVLFWIDYACMIYFLLEATLKIRLHGFRGYWAVAWNRFDFIVVLLSMPSLLAPLMNVHAFAIFLVLRVGRLFRFFRIFHFIPNANKIFAGVGRSLRASVGIFAALFILNFSLAMGGTMLFAGIAPEHFGDPLRSAYSLFKVFTVEGWYEIPDALAEKGISASMIGVVRGYFIISVLTGGILGLSLANAIFVDEMTVDNTLTVEKMVGDLHREMNRLHAAMRQEQTAAWEQMQAELKRVQELMEKMKGGRG